MESPDFGQKGLILSIFSSCKSSSKSGSEAGERSSCRSPFSESIPNLYELLGLFGKDATPETQKHLEGRMTATVEELKTERLFAIKMARLFHCKDCPDL